MNLQAKSSLNLDAGVKLLAPAVATANRAARRKLERQQPQANRLGVPQLPLRTGRFPTPVLFGGTTGKVPYSWRVAILPYLEQNPLYQQYNFNEPWDGPNNRKLLHKMPAVLSYPGVDGSPISGTNSAYFVFTGKGTALSPSSSSAAAGGMAGFKGTPPGYATPVRGPTRPGWTHAFGHLRRHIKHDPGCRSQA